MTAASTEARVQALMDKFDKLKHAEIQLYSGGLIWGDAYEAKKAPIRAMQAELESALRQELSGKDAGWLPIETAPKDGATVLLYGLWAGEINGQATVPTTDIGYWLGGKSDEPGDDWWQLSTGDAYSCWMRPTHWQPLPPPPAIQSTTKEPK